MNVVKQVTYALLILATIGVGMGFQRSGPMSSSAQEGDRTWSKHRAYEQQRSRAHRRMKNTMYASTPDRVDVTVMCPALRDGRRGPPITLDWRGAFLMSDATRYSAKSDEVESALDFFLNNISGPIVQAKCINCHVEGGVSGHTRLVFQSSSNPDHGTLNLATIRNLLSSVEDGAELILNKIQGVGHGGGVQVAAGTADFANMERLLELLGYGDGSSPDVTPETLFDTVTMASLGRTLRRAALIFGGKIPTREEREAVDNGTEEELRAAIRGLMTGRGFHEFLIRASNDRLLTDRHLSNQPPIAVRFSNFVDLVNLHWKKSLEAFEKGYEDRWDDPEYGKWIDRIYFGAARAPLELIAHVVENDLPYTEILMADYIMANPMVSEGYGASIQFDDTEDPLEFKPSEIVSYYRDDESKVIESRTDIGDHVLDPGNLSTDYPHAGILNTTVFLRRYPTTPTNRNRARSRWTYYHFLGLDIEKSASRTTDPVALADTDNPTMKNPACTVCHRVMDPVAGTFQNYGEDGEYRDEWGGLDSLDKFYKDPPDGSYTPYQYGDSWYRDMREPGFAGEVAPNSENSLQWLAERIVADDRFAEATVKFWWPAILGVEVAEPPEDRNDNDFEAMLVASNAQSAEVQRLAEAFRTGIAGGKPYNLKDLLVEIVLSPWFRAESIKDDDPMRMAALRNAGAERLLTPEELAWKTQMLTGYGWGRYINSPGFEKTTLTGDRNEYGLLYGGIDSDAVTERTDDVTAVMAAVAQVHAAEVSCPIVKREFRLLPDDKRRLFSGIEEQVSPVSEFSGTAVIEADSWKERETNSWSGFLTVGDKNLRLRYPNNYWDPETELTRDLILDVAIVRDQAGTIVSQVEFETLPEVILWDTPRDERESGCEVYHYYNEGKRRPDGYRVNWCDGWLDIPISIPTDGSYEIEVVAFQSPKVPGEEDAKLEMVVESDFESSQGARAIRNKLVELHEKLLGVAVTTDSPDVDAAFQLFVEVWAREREYGSEDWGLLVGECEDVAPDKVCYPTCSNTGHIANGDIFYFEGIVDDDLTQYNEWGELTLNEDRVEEILDDAEFHGESPASQAWSAVLAYFLTDYRYLYH
ncbi:MAG: DUF1588 domain-containing protein [Acidobacteriota bacterium]|nr:DUF1588 domain-containing protein [Acidobacteriota bacterium]